MKMPYILAVFTPTNRIRIYTCVFQGTEAYSGKAIRISKSDFENIKIKLQLFEKENFPELNNSFVEHGPKNSQAKSEREYRTEMRTGKPSRREEVKQILERAYSDSVSTEDFFSKIREQHLETYERGGKIVGIAGEKNMRFTTLGYTEEKFQELNIRQDRHADLEELRGDEIKTMQKEEYKESQEEEDLDRLRNLER